ncbi:MAG: branched-chain amino acid ABC transporter substrate-binding protein [Pseudomonadota bacterium]
MGITSRIRVLLTAAAFGTASLSFAAEPVRVAYIDPMSGPFASTGAQGIAQFRYAADVLVNEKGGVLGGRPIEIVGFDNKVSPKETLIQLQVAIDRGIRFIAQGNGSHVANALNEAIVKHNRRNPDKRVLYMNYSAVDPVMTNEKCNFWHFRFDANADIKMDALTDVMAADADLKKVYIIGQDYSFGKSVASAATRMLADKRPDIEIVGNELHPIGKVKDFTPFARKIMASGADAVITGNWGADMVGIGKSVIGAGFDGPIYTFYAASDGITRTLGADGKGKIRIIGPGSLNPPQTERVGVYVEGFKARHPDKDVAQPRITHVVSMLAQAINDAGTADDVAKVASAMEGMEHDSIWGGKVVMRAQDHQAIQNVYVMAHSDENISHDLDNSGFGLLREATVEQAGLNSPTTCDMQRP